MSPPWTHGMKKSGQWQNWDIFFVSTNLVCKIYFYCIAGNGCYAKRYILCVYLPLDHINPTLIAWIFKILKSLNRFEITQIMWYVGFWLRSLKIRLRLFRMDLPESMRDGIFLGHPLVAKIRFNISKVRIFIEINLNIGSVF